MESEAIHEAFEELRIMRIITEERANLLRIDRTRLSNLGYTLVLGDNLAPAFIRLSDLQYAYNPILYTSDYIPKTTLRTYVVTKIKNEPLSK